MKIIRICLKADVNEHNEYNQDMPLQRGADKKMIIMKNISVQIEADENDHNENNQDMPIQMEAVENEGDNNLDLQNSYESSVKVQLKKR